MVLRRKSKGKRDIDDILGMIEYHATHGVWQEDDYTVRPCEGCPHPTGTLRLRSTVLVHRRRGSVHVSGADTQGRSLEEFQRGLDEAHKTCS